MILDELGQWRQYAAITPLFEQAFTFLHQVNDLTPEGRIEIDGDEVFAIVVKTTTKLVDGRALEVHRRYLDIHYVHRGSEAIYWAPLATLSNPTMPYDPEQDAALFPLVAGAQPIIIARGQFGIFFPNDGHIPSCIHQTPGEVFKAVIKVKA